MVLAVGAAGSVEVAGLSTAGRYRGVVAGKVHIVVGMEVVLVPLGELGCCYGLVWCFPRRHRFAGSPESVLVS